MTPARTDRRIAVIGCGSIGKRHARNLLALGLGEVAVYDADTERALAFAAENEALLPLSHMGAVWAFEPRGVVVATPPSFHLEHALEAARRGCDVLVEKPLAVHLEGVEQLEAALRQADARLLMGSNFKFHPSFVSMKRLLDDGTIGRVISFNLVAGQYLPDWHPWEDYRRGYSARTDLGGGVLLDAHEFDYLQWLIGPVKRVACIAGRYSPLEIETEDVAELVAETEGGALGGIHVDYIQRPYRRTYAFYGELGAIEWSFRERRVLVYRSESDSWEESPEPQDYDLNDMYLEEARHFVDVMERRVEPITDLASARRALAVVEAARASSAAGKAVVL